MLETNKQRNVMLDKMAATARKIALLVKVVFGLYIVSYCVAFAVAVVRILQGKVSVSQEIGIIPVAISVIAGAVTLFILIELFQSISKLQSPFTLAQAKRIRIIGILLLVIVAAEMFIPLGTFDFGTVANVEMQYLATSGTPTTFIDLKLILAAILCFCLSYVFKYGAYLQWVSDETF